MTRRMMTMDGNTAAAYISYAFSEVATIYPITPSSVMPELVDKWASEGKKNIFGEPVKVSEMQSEAGAAGAMHGSLVSGALTTTYTASQGLLLMIPNMYKMSGENLPGVFHVSARALASHALSIFGDHQDVMSARAAGFAMLATGSVQEVMDLAPVAHLASLEGKVPFMHFFDGFRTSHEVQKIEVLEYEELAEMLNREALEEFRKSSLNPENPKQMGTAQNPDVYFQSVEASNTYYEDIIGITEKYMDKINEATGKDYGLFNYYGHEEATKVIVAMGSVTETIKETIDYLNQKGEKLGLVKVRLFRPFSAEHFRSVLPKTVEKIAVLDRTKEKGSIGEPLYLDIKAALYGMDIEPEIVGGIYGLGSKDTTPTDIKSVYDHLDEDELINQFTISINDDVTHRSLKVKEEIDSSPEGTIRCKFWGLGSDGTVGANQSAIRIIGDSTDLYAQGYFEYDSKKSGGITISHLRFGPKPIHSTYLIDRSDFISCSNQAYVDQYDLLKGIEKGGTFLLNTLWEEGEELNSHLPNALKKKIAENDVNFYIVNASGIAKDIGLGGRINMVMQSAFFKLSEVIPQDLAMEKLREAIVTNYGRYGEDVVEMNYKAVDAGVTELQKIDVPEEWKDLEVEVMPMDSKRPDFVTNVADIMNRHEGDSLPVSAFVDHADGSFPLGTSAYEKRGIALSVPEWQIENCIQCNQCSFVCPHAVIRPFLVDEDEKKNAPENFETKKAIGPGLEEVEYRIQISPLDCTGCGNCADICPSPKKALIMEPFEEQLDQQKENWEFAVNEVSNKSHLIDKKQNVKNSQFSQPLMEFSGACAGCGETPYAKLVTQLFGDHMMIANATGCTSIWGGSCPSNPYTKNHEGKGPAWANSLFEDNAEYGYGMALGVRKIRHQIKNKIEEFLKLELDTPLNAAFEKWMEGMNNYETSKEATEEIQKYLDTSFDDDKASQIIEFIKREEEYLPYKSMWIFGGDGWAYDIGFGGLDHVLASGEDVNVFVFDTEVYSNTGGQASKSTQRAAVAQFAASGKRIRKKDLGLMMTTYGYVYVAQIAMGANYNQTLRAIKEAEAYDGPSLIIAYSPCISHGIKGGMGKSMEQMKKAVDAGYWHLYRYNPELEEEGENPFVLDSKEPSESFRDFIESEVRYRSLKRNFPQEAEELFEACEEDAKKRYENYLEKANREF